MDINQLELENKLTTICDRINKLKKGYYKKLRPLERKAREMDKEFSNIAFAEWKMINPRNFANTNKIHKVTDIKTTNLCFLDIRWNEVVKNIDGMHSVILDNIKHTTYAEGYLVKA